VNAPLINGIEDLIPFPQRQRHGKYGTQPRIAAGAVIIAIVSAGW